MKLTKEQIEAIAYQEYPSIFQAKDGNVEAYRLRQAFIKGMETMQEMETVKCSSCDDKKILEIVTLDGITYNRECPFCLTPKTKK